MWGAARTGHVDSGIADRPAWPGRADYLFGVQPGTEFPFDPAGPGFRLDDLRPVDLRTH
ncbi:hypothetical protein FTUN_2020 [Frigoriglobus tundricola]|uniref:Uncharacterized protein n=1 Tax=Frigoriglobus tundricola TaxID=2774151 RepID=A0A6M5YKA3_9BACT|nr:hypothetical protein FTUN_2020 [Frigoriglobus tundricola]